MQCLEREKINIFFFLFVSLDPLSCIHRSFRRFLFSISFIGTFTWDIIFNKKTQTYQQLKDGDELLLSLPDETSNTDTEVIG